MLFSAYMQAGKTVFVGLSGGVDSSVAALRLKKQGYTVVGVFIKVWHPDFLECNWQAERLDAMRVAAKLDIPFLTCDAEHVYREAVGEYFVREYEAGRTPNPDVLCNKHVKFGAFLDFALERGADFVATGHYAQIRNGVSGRELLRGVDHNKDQSYFLWQLTPTQLEHILLPVGDSTKEAIRREAAAAGLLTAEKKDSQGICFLGHVDIKEFLSHFIDLTPGPVLDHTGHTIGTHEGAIIYTLGQRHGFTLHTDSTQTKPHYVVAKDCQKNTITVAEKPLRQEINTQIQLTEVNWTTAQPEATEVLAQFRYRQQPFAVSLSTDIPLCLTLQEATETPAPGQSCVLYDGEVCLGGGIIAA